MPNLLFYLIEFVDELVFGLSDASWPLIRSDLGLSYLQIGLALSVPGLISSFIEPFIGILADVWKRWLLILVGGIFFCTALFLTAFSQSFLALLLSFVVFHPSSGAFVSLSQASLMDLAPNRQEQNMARWTFAGSLGVISGPLLLGFMLMVGFGWRPVFLLIGCVSAVVLFFVWKFISRSDDASTKLPGWSDVFAGLRAAFKMLRRPEVVRWLILLEFSDLMLDVLYGFLALYFVDVVGFSVATAALAVTVWTGVGMLGDFLLIPLLEHVDGLKYLRWSVGIELVLFPAFLLVSQPWLKLVLLGLTGLFNSGWYAILKANLYASLPGQSGMVMALNNISGFFGKLLPFGIGLAAQFFGLQWAMWLLMTGPIVVILFLPNPRENPG
ncbi:MAG: MFS transporter [Chloroflexi bacterium]|nr:MFS transporter [Chloroflexota bacterium]